MNKKLAIITVNYKTYLLTKRLQISLMKQTSSAFRLFIIDVSDRKKRVVFKGAKVIKAENKGYAAGVNKGLRSALENGHTNFVVINNDTEVSADFVKNCLNVINSHPKSVIGGKIYYYPGCEYHKDQYTQKNLGKVIWYAGGNVDWKNALTLHRGVDEIDDGQYSRNEKTDFVTGCLMCFDKNVIDEIGMLDETFFLYFEDADFCERAKQEGIDLYYDPSIIIWHKNAKSTGGVGSKIHEKYQTKNRFKFGMKYAPLKTKLHLVKNYFGDLLLKY